MNLLPLLFVGFLTTGYGFSNFGIARRTFAQPKAEAEPNAPCESVSVDVVPCDTVPCDTVPCDTVPCDTNFDTFDFESDSEKSNTIIFFPGKLNRAIPEEMYGDFLSKLREQTKVCVAKDSYDDNYALLNTLSENEKICIVSHSTSANDALNLCKRLSDDCIVDNIVLIDPIDYLFFKNDYNLDKFDLMNMLESAQEFEENISDFIEANKFELLKNALFSKNDYENKKINSKVLVLNTKLSKRWKIIPPIPPISKYSINLKHIRKKTVRNIDAYGHFDILDTPWANMVHNSISKGAADRDAENIENYHTILTDIINQELH